MSPAKRANQLMVWIVFSLGLQQRVIPGLSFFVFSLIVELRHFNDALVCNLRAQLPAAEEPTLNTDNYSLVVLSPEDQTRFIRLQHIIFSNPVGPAFILKTMNKLE